jgi:hypothetical protein
VLILVNPLRTYFCYSGEPSPAPTSAYSCELLCALTFVTLVNPRQHLLVLILVNPRQHLLVLILVNSFEHLLVLILVNPRQHLLVLILVNSFEHLLVLFFSLGTPMSTY